LTIKIIVNIIIQYYYLAVLLLGLALGLAYPY